MRGAVMVAATAVVAVGVQLTPAAGLAGGAPDTVRVSVGSSGQQANNINGRFSAPGVNGNGDVVAFDSIATNLVPSDTNRSADVFVRDRAVDATERVSVSSRGRQGNEDSQRPDVDGDGRLVVFDSGATNLAPGADANGGLDVFIHDRGTGRTTLVSEALEGDTGNAQSFQPAISRDGRYVAFTSDATDLTPGPVSGGRDIFVRDLETGRTRVVSRAAPDDHPVGGGSNSPSISAHGEYVAFATFASDAVPGDTNAGFDVFVRDRLLGQTTRVSVNSQGRQARGGDRTHPSISSDGKKVTFASDATNLVADDTNDTTDIFVHNRSRERTTRVNVGPGGAQANGQSNGPGIRGGSTFGPDISGNGRYVAFDSIATNLVADDTNTCTFAGGPSFPDPGRCPDIFVRDRQQHTTERVSVSAAGTQADSASTDPAISGAGQHVVFFSAATNLIVGDTNTCPPFFSQSGQCPDIYLHTS